MIGREEQCTHVCVCAFTCMLLKAQRIVCRAQACAVPDDCAIYYWHAEGQGSGAMLQLHAQCEAALQCMYGVSGQGGCMCCRGLPTYKAEHALLLHASYFIKLNM
jgi:hypothetical protein